MYTLQKQSFFKVGAIKYFVDFTGNSIRPAT